MTAIAGDAARLTARAGRTAPPARRPGAAPTAALLRMQRLAGNAAVTRAVQASPCASCPVRPGRSAAVQRDATGVRVQRCGGSCGCRSGAAPATQTDDAERDGALQRTPAAAVQRVDADFAVGGLSGSAAGTPRSIFFDRDSSAVAGTEDTKFAAFAAVPLSTIELKGGASEEETSRATLADARMDAVETKLQAATSGLASPGTLRKTRNLGPGRGRIDYRGARRVEILVAGAPSSMPNCSAGADIDPGPAPNVFTTAFTHAKDTLLPDAIAALGSPAVAPARPALALFGGTSRAPSVRAGLNQIKGHFPNMAPHIPLNDPTAAGHRVINACEGDVLAYNQGTGAGARMTVGPKFLTQSLDEQALTLIHEGSHGTAGLATDDKAYSWQRLLAFLPPADALANADSYTHLVRLIRSPGAASGARVDTASALPSARRAGALASLAWLEQWLVQVRLQLRSLYSAVNTAVTSGAWDASDGWYRDTMMTSVATRFGLTAPPAVPTADDRAAVAGIFDRVMSLRFAVTGKAVTFGTGPTNTWNAGPGDRVTLTSSTLRASTRDRLIVLLQLAVGAAPFIESGRRAAYVGMIEDIGPEFGTP